MRRWNAAPFLVPWLLIHIYEACMVTLAETKWSTEARSIQILQASLSCPAGCTWITIGHSVLRNHTDVTRIPSEYLAAIAICWAIGILKA